MVQRNIRNHAHPWLNHVGGIQSPAHAYFEHGQIDFPPRKIFKRHSRQHLKEARMPWQLAFADQPLRRTIHHVVQQGKIIIADFSAINSDPLINANQVRRRI